ncbi:MAG TPA: phospholipase D-like domain-containing protein, partial [Bacteroidota bacterium]|nr:phospholipase D-like domain-containing protein [Bacteroidota bacterium]
SCVQLLDGTTVIDAFAWDAGTTLAGEGNRFTPTNTNSDKKSFQRKSGPSATANDALGDAWDSNDNASDFFQNTSSTANPQNSSSPIEVNPYGVAAANGIGTMALMPAKWQYNASPTFTFTFKPAGDTVRGFKIVKPKQFFWSSSSITVQPAVVSATANADTLVFYNFVVKGTDSIVVTIPGVTSADTTDSFTFNVQSSKDSVTFSPLQAQPSTIVIGSPRPMSWIKVKDASGNSLYANRWVVVRGVVTVADELGGPSYLQDATAGISVFDSSVTNNVDPGDDVILFGKVSPYYNMFELNPCSLLQTVDQGVSVDTTVLTISQIQAQPQNGVEPYECKLIRVNNIASVATTSGSTATTWAVTGSGTNYELVSGKDTLEVRISAKTNVANSSVPSGKFDVVGVLGQYTSYYQLIPRSFTDFILEGAGPRITSGAPYESAMTSTSITLTWTTDAVGTSTVSYDTTISYTHVFTDTNAVTNHKITITGLMPATMYHVRLGSANTNGTTYTNDYLVSTASKTSTGTMNVYFNHSVNTVLAKGENAQYVEISSKLINRINAATYSIDVALYSLSGTVGANVAAALISAKNRGVKVRVIGEADNQSTSPWGTLKSAGITVIFDTFDAINAGAGLMHNKFLIFDNRDTTSDTDDWVWTGSWNATDDGNAADAQNVIEIQDKALANAYTTEFNEMWGSNTDTPNASTSRFGARKLDNTPHYFIINNTPVQLFFSPSDGTTAKIINTINKATNNIDFCLLTFTRSDIANALIALEKKGLKIRGVLSNNTDQGSVFDTLKNSGVDIFLKNNTDVSGFLHHKYGIIDAGTKASSQYVITGSHNWTSSAENSNNENTLIINNTRIANLYLQEFSNRYTAAGGNDVLAGIETISTLAPKAFQLQQNYPNPFNPATSIAYDVPLKTTVTLKVFDVLGRELVTLVQKEQSAGSYRVQFDASKFASGIYFYRLQAGSFVSSKKMVLMK